VQQGFGGQGSQQASSLSIAKADDIVTIAIVIAKSFLNNVIFYSMKLQFLIRFPNYVYINDFYNFSITFFIIKKMRNEIL
jgi:hypothetical protein